MPIFEQACLQEISPTLAQLRNEPVSQPVKQIKQKLLIVRACKMEGKSMDTTKKVPLLARGTLEFESPDEVFNNYFLQGICLALSQFRAQSSCTFIGPVKHS